MSLRYDSFRFMRVITDLHLHSRFSRACSKDLTLPNIAKACERKGIQLIGTSDALHPAWLKEIDDQLEEAGEGAYKLKGDVSPTRFILSTEISCIYKHLDKVRRVHHVVLFPSREAAHRLADALVARKCNIKSDGRPIIGLNSQDLLKLVLEADEKCLLIPAHAWTPWFSIFGSKSGYDSLQECFGDLTKHIYAIETGLSSDPLMNWRLSALDGIFLVSNSDAHSCDNLGREANVFEMTQPSYDQLYTILSQHKTEKFIETIEFFPEEGKYHADGHASCDVWCEPEQTKKYKGACPSCGKPLTVGVLSRVADLADRPPHPSRPIGAAPFRSIVPLAEIIADALDVGKKSKKVVSAYDQIICDGRTEFGVLLDLPESELSRVASPEIVASILNMRNGNVEIRPGFDGLYGIVKIAGMQKKSQSHLV